MKHTPGPWMVREESVYTRIVAVDNGTWIANLGVNDDRHLANARLIAAAPKLLEALEKVISRVYLPEEWEQDVVDAIAEATGE